MTQNIAYLNFLLIICFSGGFDYFFVKLLNFFWILWHTQKIVAFDIHNIYFAFYTIFPHILHFYDFKLNFLKLISSCFMYILIYVLKVARLRSSFKQSLFWNNRDFKIPYCNQNLFDFFLFTIREDTLTKSLYKSYIEQTASRNFRCCKNTLKTRHNSEISKFIAETFK